MPLKYIKIKIKSKHMQYIKFKAHAIKYIKINQIKAHAINMYVYMYTLNQIKSKHMLRSKDY